MADLVFNIRNIFQNKVHDDCLVQYESTKYLIPSYQRGYKWSSDDNGAVTRLLNDLWSVFNNVIQKEYYLQYITVKQNKALKYLEVIDGQQRLTTLSILISYLTMMTEAENISANRLEYSARSNFFETHIYDSKALSILVNQKWDDKNGLDIGDDFNTQDVYYLFKAIEKIHSFFEKNCNREDFLKFLLEKVKLIVNVVEQHIPSEKVFGNLNNKILLTEEELIKGLFITRLGRSESVRKKSFHEIELIRKKIGREWDQISTWASREDISIFFFNGQVGIKGLLILVAQSISTESNKFNIEINDKVNPLFEFFNSLEDFTKAYENLVLFYHKLNDWFLDTDCHNLLGYVSFAPNSKYRTHTFILTCLRFKSKSAFLRLLKDKIRELIPENLDKLNYGSRDNNFSIHKLLLALSVFNRNSNERFDFTAYSNRRWSLEHIFPQSPEGKNQAFTELEKSEVKKMLEPIMDEQLENLLKLPIRNEDQKDIIYSKLNELKILHTIGNMCLLTRENNSSLGCGLFKAKRSLIFDLTKEGHFVPKHTFEVFSKMVIEDPGDLLVWSKANIEAHAEWIKNQLVSLRNRLKL